MFIATSETPPVLDTNILRSFVFAHPSGLEVVLRGLRCAVAQTPLEVYARDEENAGLEQTDEDFSELARGLRMARRKARDLPSTEALRYQTWITNAQQRVQHLERGSLLLCPLTVPELLERDRLQRTHLIGRGEAACLVLAQRADAPAVFVSEDDEACKLAVQLGVRIVMRQALLIRWLEDIQPSIDQLEVLILGLERARFTLSARDAQALRAMVS
jgi:predicted nucleic acid-binding protein